MTQRPPPAALVILATGVLGAAAFATPPSAAQPPFTQTWRYVKPAGDGFAPESEICRQRQADRTRLTSVTHRGPLRLVLQAEFDSEQRLQAAQVAVERAGQTETAQVTVADGRARIERAGKPPVELACPPGVIVTSAPDWTDSVLAATRYDRQGPKTQSFPGLWIHPTRDPLELSLRLTHVGRDTVHREGTARRLDRFLLVLRGGSRYTIWCDPPGQLVRLLPEGGSGGIVLAGWEQATRGLQAAPAERQP